MGETHEILDRCGFNSLSDSASIDDLKDSLRLLSDQAAGLDELDQAALREAAIQWLKRKDLVDSPARIVDAAMKAALPDQLSANQPERCGRSLTLRDPDPWREPVDGAGLLDELMRTVARFMVLPSESIAAIALWCLWTYCFERFYFAPMLEVSSPTKRCGKTTLLDLLQFLVFRPLPTSNITAAALFRTVEAAKPCLLIDEADSFLKNKREDEIRNVLNAGHRLSNATILRCAGDDHEVRAYKVFCPKAVALIGELPSTLRDRSITIELRRKPPSSKVEPLRADRFEQEGQALQSKCLRWAMDNGHALEKDPQVPASLNDRQSDNWRPLLAIADRAGGAWPPSAREAARRLSGHREEETEASIQLLSDLKGLFSTSGNGRLASQHIVERLAKMEDRPWPEWRQGKPITTRQLANILKRFGIKPSTVRLSNNSVLKGYKAEAFEQSWLEYCQSPSSGASQPLQSCDDGALSRFEKRNAEETGNGSENGSNPSEQSIVTHVTYPEGNQLPLLACEEGG